MDFIPETFNAAAYFVDRHVSEGRGGDVAIECGDELITYQQVVDRVNRVGSYLRHELDVRPEERVVVLLPDGPEFIYCFFGTMKIGAVPIPTSTMWKPPDYEYVLRDSGAAVAIVSSDLMPQIRATPGERFGRLREIVVAGNDANRPSGGRVLSAALARAVEPFDAEPTSKDAPAFWLFSSGSTGSPKGCVHLHHDMVVCAELYARGVLGIARTDRCFSVAKLFFAYGLGNAMYFPFAVGATTILWPGVPSAPNVYAVIERHRPTLFFSVPTNFGMLLAHRRDGRDFDLSSIRLAVSAGEALPAALFERFKKRFGVEILDGIGSTEILHIFISNRPGAVRPGSSGQVVPGYEAKLLDEEGGPVSRGDIGNLFVRGDSTCTGYWNKHEQTKKTIEGHWIRTGDKYYEDADGFYWSAGRSDDMLKVGGIWVSPVELENVLIEHPSVLECGVGARQDADQLMKPVAYVVLRDGTCGTPDLAQELQQFVRDRLAEYKRPRWIEFLPELPKTATGKIQRYKLREIGGRS